MHLTTCGPSGKDKPSHCLNDELQITGMATREAKHVVFWSTWTRTRTSRVYILWNSWNVVYFTWCHDLESPFFLIRTSCSPGIFFMNFLRHNPPDLSTNRCNQSACQLDTDCNQPTNLWWCFHQRHTWMGHVVQTSAEDHKVLIASMFSLCPWMRIIGNGTMENLSESLIGGI